MLELFLLRFSIIFTKTELKNQSCSSFLRTHGGGHFAIQTSPAKTSFVACSFRLCVSSFRLEFLLILGWVELRVTSVVQCCVGLSVLIGQSMSLKFQNLMFNSRTRLTLHHWNHMRDPDYLQCKRKKGFTFRGCRNVKFWLVNANRVKSFENL